MKIINFLAGLLLLSSLFINSEAQEVKVEDGVVAPSFVEKRFITRSSENVQEEINRGLEYLNSLREKVGLVPFKLNSYLSKAAYNHALYMAVNRIVGHYESEGYSGFTGVTPSDRVVYAGYPSRYVGENLSYGQENIYESIDGLFSAIYHRLGFLDFNYDEVGIGIYENFYVYDMGNSKLSEYCENPEEEVYGQYYYDICADESAKVPPAILDMVLELQPDYVLWPPVKDNSVPPAFFEESPDPLPDYSVSGYPVSISFNPLRYRDSTIELKSFQIYEDTGDGEIPVENTRLLDKDSDPNGKIDRFQFALFPLERLRWNTDYIVSADFVIDGNEVNFVWEFKTKSIGMPYYEVSGIEEELPIRSGEKYAIYFKPLNPNDVIERFSYSYSPELLIDEIGYIDSNTLYIKVTGKIGDEITIDTGSRKVTLRIADEDNAIYPESNKTVELKLGEGWNLIGSSSQVDLKTFNLPGIQILWKYKNGRWFAWSPDGDIMKIIELAGIGTFDQLDPYDGVWIKTSEIVFIRMENVH